MNIMSDYSEYSEVNKSLNNYKYKKTIQVILLMIEYMLFYALDFIVQVFWIKQQIPTIDGKMRTKVGICWLIIKIN